MRKKVMSTSKRKWIVSGLLGFGAVALLTTGFATWVVGVNKSNTTIDPSTTVEGTKNSMINLSLSFATEDDKKVCVSENNVKGTFIKTEAESPATDFVVKPTIKIEIGRSLGQEAQGVTFELGYKEVLDQYFPLANEAKHKASAIDDNKVLIPTATKTHKAKTEPYTYFDISNESALTIPVLSDTTKWKTVSTDETKTTLTGLDTNKWDVVYTSNSIVYTLTKEITLFTWGSFFGGVSPVTYYDDLYNNGVLAETGTESQKNDVKDKLKLHNSAEDIDFVVNEMNHMRDLFNPKTLNVVAKLSTQTSTIGK